jgi:uncharacterized protein YkwD
VLDSGAGFDYLISISDEGRRGRGASAQRAGVARPVSLSADEQAALALTNAYRASQGRAPLSVSALLMQIARQHAQNLASLDRYGDDGRNGHILFGQDVAARAVVVGYDYLVLGENVGWNVGYADPAGQLVVMWWNSPGHQANMLDGRFTEMGVGFATSASGNLRVQVFGQPA